jgi:hypothetical protein
MNKTLSYIIFALLAERQNCATFCLSLSLGQFEQM